MTAIEPTPSLRAPSLRRLGIALGVALAAACGEPDPAASPEAAPVRGARLGPTAESVEVTTSAHEVGVHRPDARQRLTSRFQPSRPGKRRLRRGELREIQRRQQAIRELLAASPPLPAPPTREGSRSLRFMDLSSFDYVEPQPDENGLLVTDDHQIPAAVQALDGLEVAMVGYMFPLDFDAGRTREFILAKVIPSCFYCLTPALNEWVEVRLVEGLEADIRSDGPVLVLGRLEVGAEVAGGFVASLFRIHARSVSAYP